MDIVERLAVIWGWVMVAVLTAGMFILGGMIAYTDFQRLGLQFLGRYRDKARKIEFLQNALWVFLVLDVLSLASLIVLLTRH